MTMIVKNTPFPDRLACERCHCEIGHLHEGELRPYKTQDDQNGALVPPGRALLAGERPVACDADSACSCHESFRQIHRVMVAA